MLQVLPYLLLGCDTVTRNQDKHQEIEQEFSLIRKRIEYQVSKKLGERLFETFGISFSELDRSLLAILCYPIEKIETSMQKVKIFSI